MKTTVWIHATTRSGNVVERGIEAPTTGSEPWSIVIGRGPGTTEPRCRSLAIPDEGLSRAHARIAVALDGARHTFRVTDLKSAFGSWVRRANGELVLVPASGDGLVFDPGKDQLELGGAGAVIVRLTVDVRAPASPAPGGEAPGRDNEVAAEPGACAHCAPALLRVDHLDQERAALEVRLAEARAVAQRSRDELRRLDEERRAELARRQELERAGRERQDEREALARRLAEAQEELARADRRREASEAACRTLREDLERAATRARSLESEVSEHAANVQLCRDRVGELVHANDVLGDENRRQNAARAASDRERAAAELRAADAERARDAADVELTAARADLDQLRGALVQAHHDLDGLRSELRRATDALAEPLASHRRRERELTAFRTALERTSALFVDTQEAVARIGGGVTPATTEVVRLELRRLAAAARDELAAVREELAATLARDPSQGRVASDAGGDPCRH